MKKLLTGAACLASAFAMAASKPASDTPGDYTHLLPLASRAKQGVLQLRLPRDVYLHARSPLLDDVRVFDANGVPQPFALQEPVAADNIGHKDLPLTIFPLMAAAGNQSSQLDLDVSTAPDGRLVSVKVRPEQGGQDAAAKATLLTGLILDLGKPPASQTTASPAVDALRFTLPPDQRDYSAQVWIETSNDLKRWDAVGAAELNWLVNQDQQTLANDRLTFEARPFRYARLTWRSGNPLLFSAIVAEQPVRTSTAMPNEQLLLQPGTGDRPQDLAYAMPPAIAPATIGVQFSETNVVLPAQLGVYDTVPTRQAGAATRRFEPIVNTTFYRITQDGQARSSGDLAVTPRHAPHWVLRTEAAVTVKPVLKVGWQPATLVFLGSGNAPYTLAVGRDRAPATSRPLAQVAPGFSDVELRQLDRATAGPAIAQQGAGVAPHDDDAGARTRLLVLWGMLLLGTGVLALMVWRLLHQKPQA